MAHKIQEMATQQALAPAHGRLHLTRILIVALVIVVIGAAATLFGWDISGWFKHVWHTITSISVGYLLAAIALITVQTTTTAFAWYSILRYAYPDSGVSWLQVLACYAAAVALNFVLPANLGTLAMLLMFTTIIVAASFAGVLAGYVAQKIFYTLIGTAGYLYLFLTVGGSFDLQLGFVAAHPSAMLILFLGVAALLFLVGTDPERADREVVGAGEGGRSDPRPPGSLLRARRAPRGDQLAGDAGHHRGVLRPPTTSPSASTRSCAWWRGTRSRT